MPINLKVEEYIYKKIYIYLEVHYQSYQNNSLSIDPHSLEKDKISHGMVNQIFDARIKCSDIKYN